MSDSNVQISEGRQGLYYGGMALTLIGVAMFLSVLVSGIASVNGNGSGHAPRSTVWVSPGNEDIAKFRGPLGIPDDAEIRVGSPGSSPSFGSSPLSSRNSPNPMTALFGMGLIAVGGVMMNVGRAGLRGSGIVLDPHGAREDLKPWNQAAGGMLDDTLRASPIVSRAVENLGDKNEPQIRVRCLKCGALGDEDAKFCDECAAALR